MEESKQQKMNRIINSLPRVPCAFMETKELRTFAGNLNRGQLMDLEWFYEETENIEKAILIKLKLKELNSYVEKIDNQEGSNQDLNGITINNN